MSERPTVRCTGISNGTIKLQVSPAIEPHQWVPAELPAGWRWRELRREDGTCEMVALPDEQK